MSAPTGQHVAKGLAQAYFVIERAAEIAEKYENKNPIADTLAGQAATGLEQDNLKGSSHAQAYTERGG
jgi:hypothetical protein